MALADEEDPTLPCGRTLSSVWSAAEDGETPPGAGAGRDPHTAGCPHCQEALARLGVLHRYVSETREVEADAEADAERTAERFTARVMDLVRTELRPGRTLPLGEPEDDAWITEAAAAKAFRAVAETLPQVHAGSCRVTLTAPHGPMKVALQLAAGFGWTVPELAERVRRLVRGAAHDRVGMDISEIDVTVVDLVADDAGSPPPGPGRNTTTGGGPDAGTAGAAEEGTA